MYELIPIQTLLTLYMVLGSALFAIILGLPVGVALYLTQKGGLAENKKSYAILAQVVDIIRSFPFAILLVALIPFTRFVVGTSLGTNAAIVPLSIATAPYFARLAEQSFNSLSKPLIEAAVLMGSSKWQIIKKIVLRESFPYLIQNFTMTCINLVGYSAMAGLVGGEGLGKVAIDYGYYRFNTSIMLVTIVILIVLVQLFQMAGQHFSKKILKRWGLS